MSLTVAELIHNNHKLDASGGRGHSQVCFTEDSPVTVQACFHELKDFIVDRPFRLSKIELKILERLEKEIVSNIFSIKNILNKILEDEKISITDYYKFRSLYSKLENLERHEEDYRYRISVLKETKGLTTKQQTDLFKKLLLDLGFEQTVNYEALARCIETFASEEYPCVLVKKIKSLCNKEKKSQEKSIKRIYNKYGIEEKVM